MTIRYRYRVVPQYFAISIPFDAAALWLNSSRLLSTCYSDVERFEGDSRCAEVRHQAGTCRRQPARDGRKPTRSGALPEACARRRRRRRRREARAPEKRRAAHQAARLRPRRGRVEPRPADHDARGARVA